MNCPQCGATVPEGAKKCPSCSTAIVWNDPNATWAGATSGAAAAKAGAADDVTNAGFKRQPVAASDVLTPPPGFTESRRPSPNDAATWMGGPDAATFGVGPNEPTSAPFNRGPLLPDSPTSASWLGAGAARAMGGPIDFGPRYKVERLLGQGGMGAVYLAYDQDLGRSVALKLVKPELMVHPEAMARFRQELLLASKISHRNILRIHDLGDAGGMKFISMAFVDGEDLHHLLIREGKLPLERMLNITRQLCAALDAAHAEGVVHRDLKPQNIMLGANDHVFVSDFGLAKSLGAVNSLTQSGEMLGTPRYMAPEQVEAKSVDARTDIYALGLIFYEMVTGDVPFTAETTLQLMYKRAHEIPPAPKTVVPDLPEWLNNVIMKCLERDPANRYQSTHEILADIDAQRKPELAPQQTVHTAYPQVAVRHASSKVWIGIVAAVVLLIAGLFAVPQVRHAFFGGKTKSSAKTSLKTVAVLPLRIDGDEKALGYVGDGIVEALAAKLTQVKGVSVPSSNAIEKIGKVDSAVEAGKALGANYVVDGSLQGSGNNLRILIALTDVKTGKQIMPPKEFSGVIGDLLTLEDNIYSDTVKALQVSLTADEMAKAIAHPTERIDAYQAYLQGRNALRGKPGDDIVKGAITDFDKAIKSDPLFALAYTGIADASLRMYRDTKDPQWAQKAVSAAEHADQLAHDLPEVHFVLGSVYGATGKSNEAVAELQNAVKLAPNSDEGYRRLGDALNAIGSKQDAIAAYSKAIEINPYYWYNFLMRGNAYFNWGKDAEAAADYKKVTELAPKNPKGFSNLGAIYMRQGRWTDAIPYFKQATDMDPTLKNAWSNLGASYFYLKRYDESAKYFEKAVALAPTAEFVGNLAEAYRWMGDKAKANAAYDRAIALALKEIEVNPRDKFTLGSLSLYYAKKGDDKMAQQYIRRARVIDHKDVALTYNSAIVNAIGGRPDEAIKDLLEAVKNGYPVGQIKDDPDFQSLASNPEFVQLLKEAGTR
jgi:tetratricopeptide (TPR) repeat protein/predicted Ser/Thr protein kinase